MPKEKEVISEQEWLRIRLAAVAKQMVDRGIRDERVLKAMREIPRHRFLPASLPSAMAYADKPLPLGRDQTISQPYIVALLAERLALTGTEIVLEIGTGSGYQAAILSRLAKEVITLELDENLAKFAKANLNLLKIENVEVKVADGSKGWMEGAPYDRIVLTAGAREVPSALLTQLNAPGILIAPVGGKTRQMLTLYEKTSGSQGELPKVVKKALLPVAFVPMHGEIEKGN